MKASDLIKNLQELVDIHGDLDLIYSSDDEGNYYGPVVYPPTPCSKNKEYDEWNMEGIQPFTHICIN